VAFGRFNPLALVADAIFPRTCSACGVAILEQGLSLCWDCRNALSVIAAPFCKLCGEPVHGLVDHDYVCHDCTKREPVYQRARAALHYNDAGKHLVISFKYHHALWLQPLLTDLLEAAVRSHYGDTAYDAVCAVPLHPVKLRERGYNQSALLAAGLAKRLGTKVLGRGMIRRIRATPSQTRLTATERLTNVKGAFVVKPSGFWSGKRLLLVDDVMTTGATVGACARVMLDAGAGYVDVITVARGY
jgi:ComF family protein